MKKRKIPSQVQDRAEKILDAALKEGAFSKWPVSRGRVLLWGASLIMREMNFGQDTAEHIVTHWIDDRNLEFAEPLATPPPY